MEEKFNVSIKLRAITYPRGIKDIELAKKMDISKQLFAYRMKHGFRHDEVKRLARFLGITKDDLL